MSNQTFQTQLQPTDDGLKQPYQSRACPHCGSTRTRSAGFPTTGNVFVYVVQCTNCRAAGPECSTAVEAKRSWEWRVK